MKGQRRKRGPLVALLALALTLGMITQAGAIKPFGTSPGDHGGRWWQWAFSIPSDQNPLFDETGERCMVDQPDKGFVYLVGVFNSTGTVVRDDCVIPKGRAIFAPLVNVECSSLEPEPFFGDDPESLAACLEPWGWSDTFAELDGYDPRTWEQRSSMYEIGPMPESNILGAEAGATGVSMASGEYVMIPPLPPGEHELHFGGDLTYGGEFAGWSLDITYHLTVR
jgi:hypothetical protein